MGDNGMDAAAKQRVVEALRAQERADLAGLDDAVGAEHAAAEVSQEDSFQEDDLSQADAAGDLAGLYEEVAARQESAVAHVEALDVGPKYVVEPGAVVAFGGERYVVGVVADSFDVDGVAYEGISADSPLYAAIAGLRLGDTFTWRNETLTIDLLA